MPYFLKPSLVLLGLPVSIILGGCGAKPECDSFETRNAVLQAIADDHNNALATFAARNPNPVKSGDASSESDKQKPLYVLGEKMVTMGASEDKRTLTWWRDLRDRRRHESLKGGEFHRPASVGWQDIGFGCSV